MVAYGEMTVAELKLLLNTRNLKRSGNKAKLIERLREADALGGEEGSECPAKKRRLDASPTMTYVEGFLIPVAAVNQLQAMAMKHALGRIRELERELAAAKKELQECRRQPPCATTMVLSEDSDDWGPWTSEGLKADGRQGEANESDEDKGTKNSTECLLAEWSEDTASWKPQGLGKVSFSNGMLQFRNGQGMRMPPELELDLHAPSGKLECRWLSASTLRSALFGISCQELWDSSCYSRLPGPTLSCTGMQLSAG